MAFLAVLREGFETAVFLLAVFQDTDEPGAPPASAPCSASLVAVRASATASTAAACASTSPASSASPGSCSCSSPPACSPPPCTPPTRPAGSTAARPGLRPRAGSSARAPCVGSLLTGMLGLQPQPDRRRGRRLGSLYAVPMLLVRALARRAGARRARAPPRSRTRAPVASSTRAGPSPLRRRWLRSARRGCGCGSTRGASAARGRQPSSGRGDAHRRRLRRRPRSSSPPARRRSRSPTTAPPPSPSSRSSRGTRILGEVENIAAGLSRRASRSPSAGHLQDVTARAARPPTGTLDGHAAGRRGRRATERRPRPRSTGYRRTSRQQTAELVDAHRGVRRRGQGRRRRQGEGALRPGARPVRARSSRWPRASATSTREIDARAGDVAKATSGPASTASSRRCGSTARTRARRRSPTSCVADVERAADARSRRSARAGADRQRRGRAARRGLEVEDHRRGGALLAHRPRRTSRPT